MVHLLQVCLIYAFVYYVYSYHISVCIHVYYSHTCMYLYIVTLQTFVNVLVYIYKHIITFCILNVHINTSNQITILCLNGRFIHTWLYKYFFILKPHDKFGVTNPQNLPLLTGSVNELTSLYVQIPASQIVTGSETLTVLCKCVKCNQSLIMRVHYKYIPTFLSIQFNSSQCELDKTILLSISFH